MTPDFTRLVSVGMYDLPTIHAGSNPQDMGTPQGGGPGANGSANANKSSSETRIIIYDLNTKLPESYVTCSTRPSSRASTTTVCLGACVSSRLIGLVCTIRSIRLEGELTSVKISADSQYALINRASENGPPAVSQLLGTQCAVGNC